jgi:hypothetical protein
VLLSPLAERRVLAATLTAGDLVVLGWNAVADTITFATLVDLPSGTVITITDKGWDQATNAFTTSATGDGEVTWTTSTSIPAGTVLRVFLGGTDAPTTLTNLTTSADLSGDIAVSAYTVLDPVIASGDGVFLYQDASANPYFLFGLNNSGGTVDASNWNTSIGATLRDSMLPNGAGSQNALTNGATAVGLPGGASQQDNVHYTGATTSADRATWLARVANAANWSGDDTGAITGSYGTSLSVAVPNTAPSVSNLNGDLVGFIEGSGAVGLDASANATVTDADSANFDTGHVTVAIIANRVAGEDVLSILNQGTGAGQVGVSGSNVTYGGTTIGAYAGGTGTNDLVITLNANATPAATQALVRVLTYANTNTTSPNTAARTVRVTVGDGDGGTSANSDVTVTVTGTNDAPTVANAIPNQNATEDAAFVFQFAANTFADVDPGAVLTYSAQLAGGGALPAWLSFDPATRTFSGTPLNAYVGTVSLDVIANDGNGGTVTDTFDIVVANTNDAPTVANPLPNRNGTEDAAFNVTFAVNTFADPDAGDTLTYTAQLAGGGALPAWLSFDAATRTFSGTPLNAHVGTVSIDVIASDGNGGTVTDTFDIVVANTNDAPTVANPIPNQNATEDAAFTFQFAANTFADPDAGATPTYAAQLAGGGALPAWLSFDAATRTFSGTPLNAHVGTVSIDLVANDGNGGTVTDTFDIVVANTNDAPTVANPLPNRNATEDAAFNVTFAVNTFTDPDAGDTLIYTAQLAGGGALPAWLSFDAATRTFSGTPASADVGTVAIDVIAADGNGGTVTDTFDIAVAATTPNPVVTSVSSTSADGVYTAGDSIVVVVSFDTAVTVDTSGGVPTLSLETGAVDRQASYVSGSGSTALAFTYLVQDSDQSLDLDYVSTLALALNGATVRAGGLDAVVTLPAPASAQSLAGQRSLVIDAVRPVVTSVAVPASATYVAGQALDFTVNWSETVVVQTSHGVPSIAVVIGTGGPMSATYLAGSGTSALTFRTTVQAGQEDTDGIVVGTLVLASGRISDAAGNDASLALQNVAATTGVRIDARAPGLTVSAPSVSSTTSGPVNFEITYEGAAAITLGTADVTLLSTGTATGTIAVTGAGVSSRTVTISAIGGAGTLAIRIAAGSAVDGAGNPALASATSATVQVADRGLTSLSPTSGLATGGVSVALTGAGFSALAAPSVLVGGVPARTVEVRNDGTLVLITPTLSAGAAVDLVVLDGTTTVDTMAAAYTPLLPVTDETVDTDSDGLPDTWELRFGLDALLAIDADADPDGDGRTNAQELADGTHPRGTWRAGLAEGVVSDVFATSLAMFNPGVGRVAAVVQSLSDTGASTRQVHDLDAFAGVHLEAAATSVQPPRAFATWIEADAPLAAEGMTSWDVRAYGAGAERVQAPASTWYLAEGSTVGGFDLFYLLANPHDAPVSVDVTLLLPAPAAALTQRHVIQAQSRLTLWVDTLDPRLASTDVSGVVQVTAGGPIIVERAMYRHDAPGSWGEAGHRAAGVAQLSTTWHFAEGFVGAPFDTYLLLGNPQGSAATVEVDAVAASGETTTSSHTVAARSRLTVHAGDLGVPIGPTAFTVRSTSGTPIVAERAMWWSAPGGGSWIEAHASAGSGAGARTWVLPDLRPGGALAASQYLFVRNLEAVPASIEVAIAVPGQDSPIVRTYPMPASGRLTLDLAAEWPEIDGRVLSAVVRATALVVVEASRYWDAAGLRWGAGVNVLGTPWDR